MGVFSFNIGSLLRTAVIAAVAATGVGLLVAPVAVATATAFGLTGALAYGAIAFATSFVLGGLSAALAKNPDQAASVFSSQGRTITIRQAISPWRIIYGQDRIGGVVTFKKVTNSNANYHMIITLAGHVCEEIGDIWFNDEVVPLDGSGNATGRFAGYVRIKKSLGTEAGQPFGDLVTESAGAWTDAHRQTGRTKIYVRLIFNRDLFPSGIPNITAVVKGKKIYDPRTITTAWSNNAALCVSDYLTNTDYGYGATYATEINEAALIAAANICDEGVNTTQTATVFTADAVTDIMTLAGNNRALDNGNGVTVSSTGTLPGGLVAATTYYISYVTYHPSGTGTTFKLATSRANVLTGTFIDLTTAGSGTHSITNLNELRYRAGGTFQISEKPAAVISNLVNAMAGKAILIGSTWRILAGAYVAPTITLTETDCAGPIKVQSLVSRRESANGVKGVFIDPAGKWQAADFPAVASDTYKAQDNNERVWKDIDLTHFVRSSTQAQRLAKIELLKGRQGLSVVMPCKMTAYRVQPGDTVSVTNTKFGWSAKVFDVVAGTFAIGDAGSLNYELSLRETAAAIFNWATSEEQTLDLAPNTNLGDPFLPAGAPAGVIAASGTAELLKATDGTIISRIKLSWTAATDAFVLSGGNVLTRFRVNATTEWTYGGTPKGDESSVHLSPVKDGVTYDLGVAFQNSIGVRSAWTTITHVVVGKTAAPSDVTAFTVTEETDGRRTFAWTNISDADISHYEIRAAQTDIPWASMTIGAGNHWTLNPSSTRTATLIAGTWYFRVKAVDTSGNLSTNAFNATTNPSTFVLAPSDPGLTPQVQTQATTIPLNYARVVTGDLDLTAVDVNVIGDLRVLPVAGTDVAAETVGATLNTQARKILAGFTFGSTDYAGALKAGDITWNAATGAVTGGSGVVVHKGGILGAAAGAATFTLNATTGAATFAGTLSAPTGNIGGFNIGADYVRDAANSFGLASTITAGDDLRFWAGATFANRATAPFRITEAGAATVSNITITGLQAGSLIDGQFLAALSISSAAIAASAITTAKIAADAVTAAEIAVGAVGSTELAAGAVIAGKITAGTIVAADIAAGTITGAKISAATITASNIAALTITAAELAAGSVTAAKISVTTLSAIAADLGSVTAGQLVVGTTNKLWLNDAADGALAIGGTVKATAPFRVSASGSAVVESISINANGTLTNAGGGAVTAAGISAIQTSLGNAPATIINSNITINPAGTLSGAGAGSVTITGLGYTGALNATTNTMYNQALDPGGVNGDTWYDATTTTYKIKVGGVWVSVGDITSGKVAASISGQGAFATVATISAANQATLIEAGVVNANRLVANSITAAQILAGTITGTQIAANTIAAGNIVANTITAAQIAAATITAAQMNVATLSAISADMGTITAGSMSGITLSIGSLNSIFKADSNGIYLGDATFASAPFRVNMSGAMVASSGTIGGFSIGTDYIRDAADSFGLASTATAGTGDIRFWAGATFANRNTAPVRIDESGKTYLASLFLSDELSASFGITGDKVINAGHGSTMPVGGNLNVAFKLTSGLHFGIFCGSGAPSISAAKGSLYLRSDGTTTNNRAYINTNGTTTWTALTTAA